MGAALPADLRIEHDESADAHFLHAYVPGEPNQIGVIIWSKLHRGLIYEVEVDERYRRRGVATLLWNAAVAGAYDPPIRMSPNETGLGMAWAASLDTGVTLHLWDGNLDTYWRG